MSLLMRKIHLTLMKNLILINMEWKKKKMKNTENLIQKH
jgi:hypothetical protein